MKTSDGLVIGFDRTNGIDKSVLIVGRQTKDKVDIMNAFQGEEALELYNKLITKKERHE